MSDIILTSPFNLKIKCFLRHKESMGHNTKAYLSVLRDFDHYCTLHGINSASLTEELVRGWLASMTNNSPKTINNKLAIISQFANYLNHSGHQAYIPTMRRKEHKTYVPYIFTKEQMLLIMHESDKLQAYQGSLLTYTFCIPAIIRTIYSLGLRIHEATSIDNENVNLAAGTIKIKRSKNGQERILPMSESLKGVIKQYKNYRDKLGIKDVDSPQKPFFISPIGKRITDSTLYMTFRKILRKCGIPHIGNKFGPHVHHLRHTFTVHSMANLIKSGKDMYCALPVLSKFLGHSTLSGTEDYIRLTEECFPEMVSKTEMTTSNLFPDIK